MLKWIDLVTWLMQYRGHVFFGEYGGFGEVVREGYARTARVIVRRYLDPERFVIVCYLFYYCFILSLILGDGVCYHLSN